MIKKVVHKGRLSLDTSKDLKFWLSKTVEERLNAVEFLRRQVDGTSQRLQRVYKVVKFAQS